MSSNSKKYRKRANLNSTIHKHICKAGLWNDSDSYGIGRVAKFYMLCFVVTNITQIIALFKCKDDPKKLFECFSVLTFCMMGFLKLWSLHSKQKEWRFIIEEAFSLENEQLNNSVSHYDYESDEELKDNFANHINVYTRKFLSGSTYLARIYSFTAFVYMVSPFLEHGICLYQGHNVNGLPHILPGWAPLDNNIIGYLATISAEVAAAIYCVKLHTAFDLTAVGLMIFIRGQFSLLHDYSMRIGGQGISCKLSKRRDDRAHNRIRRCHHIHVSLINSIIKLGELIQNILGIYFFVSTLTLCCVAVQLNWGHMSLMQLISLLQYMGATITQLFLFCHFGDGIANESLVSLGQGPFCSACWCLSPKIRREIAILCVGMSRSYIILAGPFNSLDLPSFIQILRTAYSCYAVLRTTSE